MLLTPTPGCTALPVLTLTVGAVVWLSAGGRGMVTDENVTALRCMAQLPTLAHLTLDVRENGLTDVQSATVRLREDLHRRTELHLTLA